MKSALVHDWLVSIGGGEKVLLKMWELFPSPIFTLVCDHAALVDTAFADKEIHTSAIQKFPWGKKKYRNYLPFFPYAIEQFDLEKYDVVISSSHCAAKGILTQADQLHICYCHTPMRYAWDLYHEYIQQSGLKKGFKALFAKWMLHYLRMWDLHAAHRVDAFVGISHFVAQRIAKIYGAHADIIYPPVDVDYFAFSSQKEDFYLAASRMVPYKRIDLIVDAFSQMPDKKLYVIGDGPEWKKIEKKAGENITLLGYQDDATLRIYLQKAKAFVFAAKEDFGILPVEAQSCGTPVIAYGRGGALETVKTGLFFSEQTTKSLMDAVEAFEKKQFDPYVARENALRFDEKRFKKEISEYVEKKWNEFRKKCMYLS